MKCRSACEQKDGYTGGRHNEIGACANKGKKALFRWTSGLPTKARFWCSNFVLNLDSNGGQWSASLPGRMSLGKVVLTG